MATGVSVTIRGRSDGLRDQDVRELYYGKDWENEFKNDNDISKIWKYWDDAKQLNDAFNSVKDNEAVFKSRITKISVEMIGENEESIIIIEKQLCW